MIKQLDVSELEYKKWVKRHNLKNEDEEEDFFYLEYDYIVVAVQEEGLELEHADPIFKDDDEVVELAIAQNFDALQFASKRLQEKYKNFTD